MLRFALIAECGWLRRWRGRSLVRPRLGRKVAGVCLGFSEYFDVDVTLVRAGVADRVLS